MNFRTTLRKASLVGEHKGDPQNSLVHLKMEIGIKQADYITHRADVNLKMNFLQ